MSYVWDTTPAEDLGKLNAAITAVLASGITAEKVNALAELSNGGSKNLLNNSASTATTNKVTFTVNDDKTVPIASAGDNTQASLTIASSYSLPAGKYIISGTAGTNATGDTYAMWMKIGSDPSFSVGETGRVFEVAATDTFVVTIIVRASQTIADVTFKPMICTLPQWELSQEYVPYQPGYAELVARVEALEDASESKTTTGKKAAAAADEGKEG